MVRTRDKGNVSLHLSDLEVLRELQTTHHRVVVYRHPHLGRVLVMDGEIQHVEVWAPLYHEPLVHLPAAFIDEPQTALVLGGGSFFVAQELLKYRSIQRVLMLDHDSELLDAIGGIYEHAANIRNDPRLEVWNMDAFRSLSKISERFDLVINDSVDLFAAQGPGVFATLAGLLRPKGVCSDVVYRHIFEDRSLNRTIRMLRPTYRTVLSLVFVPEYPGILHLLTLWSKSKLLTQERRRTLNREQRAWASAPHSNPCSYFDARFLAYYLHLPRTVRDQLQEGSFT